MSESTANVMEQIVSLCKRRGFVYGASDIYGGLNGFWDYGPLGVLLKNNIRDWWWRNMVEVPPIGPDGHPIEMVGIDSSIIQNPKTWVASGHAATFTDPMVDDRESKQRFRADHLAVLIAMPLDGYNSLSEEDRFGNPPASYGSLRDQCKFLATSLENAKFGPWVEGAKVQGGFRVVRNHIGSGDRRDADAFGYSKFVVELEHKPTGTIWRGAVVTADKDIYRRLIELPSPFSGNRGTLTEPRAFNLMFQTYVGAIQDESSKAYLRPETAQGIFLNFKNIVDTTRVKVPFGVAQIGKSFRNEVTPRNFIFRSREFEQMEMEWFCHPDDARKWYDFWKEERMKWWRSLGVSSDRLRFRDHEESELSHYSKMTVDIEYKYPFTDPDFGELEGIAHRGCYDLTQHQEHSGQKLDYFDQDLQLELKAKGIADDEVRARSRYIPNVIEPASGLTRAVLVLLCEGYTPDESRPSKMYMKFHPRFAPIKAGIFPLVNKDGMPEVAEKLYMDLRQHFTCEYDPKQNIGKRYARMDEIGTPYCVTVDGDTLKDQTVTVRHRDQMTQERISLDKIRDYLQAGLNQVT